MSMYRTTIHRHIDNGLICRRITMYHIQHGIINFSYAIQRYPKPRKVAKPETNNPPIYKLRENHLSCIRYENTPSNNFPSTNDMRGMTKEIEYAGVFFFSVFYFNCNLRYEPDHFNGFISMKSSEHQPAIPTLIKLLTFSNWGLQCRVCALDSHQWCWHDVELMQIIEVSWGA